MAVQRHLRGEMAAAAAELSVRQIGGQQSLVTSHPMHGEMSEIVGRTTLVRGTVVVVVGIVGLTKVVSNELSAVSRDPLFTQIGC